MRFLFAFVLAAFSAPALAAPAPITGPVDFANEKFAKMVTLALKKNITPKREVRAGGSSDYYVVARGLTCAENRGFSRPGAPSKVSYSCSILPAGGWRFMGMESYGSGSNEEFSKALYDALSTPATREDDFTAKTLELNEETGRGTDRNQLICMRPTKRGEGFVKNSCQFINNL